jgi:peroxiredoxin
LCPVLNAEHDTTSYFHPITAMSSPSRLLSLLLAACLITLPATRAFAEGPAAPAASADGVSAEFKQVFEKIVAKIKSGQKTEADLAAEIGEIDAILAKHASEKTDDVAAVALMKARLYLEVFENTDKGIVLLKEVKMHFPESNIAKNIDEDIAAIEQQAATDKLLAIGQPFPAFSEKDLSGQPLALADFKGKIVLIDFWATWCGPCVAELPNVIAAYEKFHSKGFEVVGISLDKSRDALTDFIKENKMPWAQYFDGLGWDSKLGQQYGIQSIPATFLLDGEGKIIAKNLSGSDLDSKLAELLK